MKSRHPSLDWIRKVLAEDKAVVGDLRAPLVPSETPNEGEPAQAAPERVSATPLAVLRLIIK